MFLFRTKVVWLEKRWNNFLGSDEKRLIRIIKELAFYLEPCENRSTGSPGEWLFDFVLGSRSWSKLILDFAVIEKVIFIALIIVQSLTTVQDDKLYIQEIFWNPQQFSTFFCKQICQNCKEVFLEPGQFFELYFSLWSGVGPWREFFWQVFEFLNKIESIQ